MILSHAQRAALIGAAFAIAFGASAAASDDDAPVVPPNAPKYVKSLQAPGLDVRYLDFKWDPEAFDSVQKGGPHPAGKRSWVLARVLATTNPFRCQGKIIPVGPSLLILNPGGKSSGPTLELRAIDLREVFVDMNVVAEPPPGETYFKGPAGFHTAAGQADTLELSLVEGEGTVDIVIHYGDHETKVRLTRR